MRTSASGKKGDGNDIRSTSKLQSNRSAARISERPVVRNITELPRVGDKTVDILKKRPSFAHKTANILRMLTLTGVTAEEIFYGVTHSDMVRPLGPLPSLRHGHDLLRRQTHLIKDRSQCYGLAIGMVLPEKTNAGTTLVFRQAAFYTWLLSMPKIKPWQNQMSKWFCEGTRQTKRTQKVVWTLDFLRHPNYSLTGNRSGRFSRICTVEADKIRAFALKLLFL